MFKFSFGAVVGFIGAFALVSKGMMQAIERDGDLRRFEEVVRKNMGQRDLPQIDLDKLEKGLKNLLDNQG